MKRPVPQSCCVEPYTPRGLPAAKVARVSWEHTRCGCTQFDWVADVGWTHRVSSSSGGRKICRGKRALARKKSAAPPDAGHGWAEGETVRVRESVKQIGFTYDLQVLAYRLSIRRKAFPGFCPSCSHRQGDAESSGSQVNTTSV